MILLHFFCVKICLWYLVNKEEGVNDIQALRDKVYTIEFFADGGDINPLLLSPFMVLRG